MAQRSEQVGRPVSEVREACPEEAFAEVALKANGTRGEIHADASIDAYSDRTIRMRAQNLFWSQWLRPSLKAFHEPAIAA